MKPHYLIILEQGEEYEIEHHPDCPMETYWIDPEGEGIKSHSCVLGQIVHDAGLDPLDNAPDDSWANLPPGRYVVEAWTQHYPSTPYHGEEWDAGLTLVASSTEF